jgi:ribosomal-protein-alanine N-acetyltransferase
MTNSRIEKMESEHVDEALWIDQSSSLTPWSREMFIEELRNPFAHCFIYTGEKPKQHAIVGFVCFRNIGGESELLNIGVHPLHRRMGIGKKLMQFYVDFSEGMQVKTFYLEVHISNPPAIRLYQCFSYQPIGTRRKFYQGKYDALIMVRNS